MEWESFLGLWFVVSCVLAFAFLISQLFSSCDLVVL